MIEIKTKTNQNKSPEKRYTRKIQLKAHAIIDFRVLLRFVLVTRFLLFFPLSLVRGEVTLDIVNRIIKRRAYLLYIHRTKPSRSISIQQIKGECLSLILSCFPFYTHRILIYYSCIGSIFAISFSGFILM